MAGPGALLAITATQGSCSLETRTCLLGDMAARAGAVVTVAVRSTVEQADDLADLAQLVPTIGVTAVVGAPEPDPHWANAGGAGTEAPACSAVGTDGNDAIRGTANGDVLCAFDGNDRVLGLGGGDVLAGGPGNDDLVGGSGKDEISGAGHDDRIDAGKGDDDVDAGSGHDVLSGAAGKDDLDGGGDRDRIDGGAGDDVTSTGGTATTG